MAAPEKQTTEGTIGDKIRHWRKAKKMEAKTLAQRARITPGYLSRVERNDLPNPGLAHLQAIARALGISLEALHCYPDDALASAVPFQIPILGQVAAGQPVDIGSISASNFLAIARDHAENFALQVTGNSMLGWHIIDGDYILVDKNASPTQGELIVAVKMSGTYDAGSSVLKRFYKYPGRVELHPENDEEPERYQPIIVPANEWERDWRIQGVVKGLYRSYSNASKPKKL